MKTFNLTLVFSLLSAISFSQIGYQEINKNFNVNSIFENSKIDTIEVDINNDGVKDFRISSWFNHTLGVQSSIEIVALNGVQNVFDIDFCGYLRSCQNSNYNFNSQSGYIYNSDNSVCNSYSGMKRFTFKINNTICVLYVNFQSEQIQIIGVAFSETVSDSYFCSNDILTIEENEKEFAKMETFNLIGQKSNIGFLIEHNGFSSRLIYK